MRRILWLALGLALVSVPETAQNQSAKTFDMYVVDTEGGHSVLYVAPTGESMLEDTGNPGGRDTDRIMDVINAAGVKQIDHLILTHYHVDHVGGLSELVKRIPIKQFIDHGATVEPREQVPDFQKTYAAMWATTKHTVVKPGDKIPLHDVQVTVVTSNGEVIAKPLAGGGPNPLCKDAQTKPPDTTENQRSAGFLLTYGRFKFLDLGDLTWDKEMELACPVEKLGTVTLLQATHHGFFGDYSGAPALYWAIKPEVVVVNNGARKGLATNAYNTIAGIPGIEGIWQMHRSVANDEAHNTVEPMIANTDPASDGHWVKASVEKDGKFTITNSRNDYSKTYTTR